MSAEPAAALGLILEDRHSPSSSGLQLLARLQHPDGAWEGEVVWCPMITAQVAIARVAIGAPFEAASRDGVIRHFAATRRPDGGWGLHPVSASRLFVTTLVYVALRLLGESPESPLATAARQWIRAHPDGVVAIPSWGKLWLAFLGLYDYRGINPCPPELFLLPRGLPVAPDHLYCHTRHIYLAIAYLYGCRFSVDLGPLRNKLREELYDRPWDEIDFPAMRHRVAASDLHVPPGRGLRLTYDALSAAAAAWRRLPGSGALRRTALRRCLERIRFEEEASRAQCLSPVNGVLNLLALWAAEGPSPAVDAALAGLEAWRWHDEDGVRYAGARSQSWDTAFAMQALAEGGAEDPAARAALRAGYRFLDTAQLQEELRGRHAAARDPVLGGWCFSDGAHGWPVSDCTAEALSAILACHASPGLIAPERRIGDVRLDLAVDFILSRQNADGGFATYERRRGLKLLERLNPSEMFGQCMTELSYVECTASAVRALAHGRAALSRRRDDAALNSALHRAVAFLRERQREDGSYPGFWGINFIYATSFVVFALKQAGYPDDDPTVAAAVGWLAAKQRADGGWGEDWTGCLDGKYIAAESSLVTGTSWAVLALAALDRPSPAEARGVAWLEAARDPTGSWPADAVNGVFFGSAMLDYRLYCTYFPAWAIARASRRGRG